MLGWVAEGEMATLLPPPPNHSLPLFGTLFPSPSLSLFGLFLYAKSNGAWGMGAAVGHPLHPLDGLCWECLGSLGHGE